MCSGAYRLPLGSARKLGNLGKPGYAARLVSSQNIGFRSERQMDLFVFYIDILTEGPISPAVEFVGWGASGLASIKPAIKFTKGGQIAIKKIFTLDGYPPQLLIWKPSTVLILLPQTYAGELADEIIFKKNDLFPLM